MLRLTKEASIAFGLETPMQIRSPVELTSYRCIMKAGNGNRRTLMNVKVVGFESIDPRFGRWQIIIYRTKPQFCEHFHL